MFHDTFKIGRTASIMLGDTVLSLAQTYRYLALTPLNYILDIMPVLLNTLLLTGPFPRHACFKVIYLLNR